MVTKRISRFTAQDHDRIKAAVHAAERGTIGEIVPMIVPRSKRYRWVHFLWALFGVFAASAALDYSRRGAVWSISFHEILLWQVLGAMAGAAGSFIPWVKRRTIPPHFFTEEVHRNCLAHFVACGLTETAERSGILIFISLFERRVEILADVGIHSKVPDGYWKEQVDAIVQGILDGRTVDALCSAIEVLGKKLAEHFPARPEHRNQLGEDLREED